MDKFPLTADGRPAGELTAQREGLYTWFSARCPLPEEGLWCAWVVGDRGELRLGVLEPEGKQGTIRRRFSGRLTAPLGRLLRGEIRPAVAKGAQGARTRQAGELRYLALPYDPAKPFPLTTLFCFARLRRIGGEDFVVYAFDGQDRPVF